MSLTIWCAGIVTVLTATALASCTSSGSVSPKNTESSTNALPPALVLTCAGCHSVGEDDGVPALTEVSGLGRKLRAYRDGTREGAVMPRISSGLSDADIAVIVRYFGDPAP